MSQIFRTFTTYCISDHDYTDKVTAIFIDDLIKFVKLLISNFEYDAVNQNFQLLSI